MTTPASVLLTVSGEIPDDLDDPVAASRRPRADYLVMAEHLGADLADVKTALGTSGRFGRLLHRAGAGPLLAWYCFRVRRDYDVIITDGEQVGLPFALLCRVLGRGRARHLMIVHVMSVAKKWRLVRIARLAPLIDRWIVYATAQAEFLRRRLAVPGEKILLTTFMVDTSFFAPDAVDVPRRNMICTAGLERRDYPTLIDAIGDLDVEVVIAAASPWSRRADGTADRELPPNVEVTRLDHHDLRDVYAASRIVVAPLVDVDFQAGITTILEGMAMGRPIVVTRTPGQTDTVEDGVTGIYVPVGDAAALRTAIVDLLDDPERAARLGAAARSWVVEHADVERYAALLATEVDRVLALPS
jgi:glycosyltransferase involved in cell wall biosynthesis